MGKHDVAESQPIDLIWECGPIGKEIGRNARQAYFLLTGGHIKGAKKVGGRWCVARGKLREQFLGQA